MATVALGPCSEGGLGLEIAIDVTLPGLASREARALIEKAHQLSPYSNAMRNTIAVRLGPIEA
jgi:lipoyl-dependent peroxiredoxin